MKEMKYITKENQIVIKIPAVNKGKFRFKTREGNFDFGKIFSARENNFTKKVYLEWQISYDISDYDIKNKGKKTKLKKFSFIGANGKKKYLYEFSELLFEAMRIGLISKRKIEILLKEILEYSEFIDNRDIKNEYHKKIKMNGIELEETSIKLPTFFMNKTADKTQIEISIQKQQYASGIQPMVYFCIPIYSFKNHGEIMDRSSNRKDELDYIINSKNISILTNLLKVFAMCSKRHNFDISEILKTLLKQF